MTRIGILNKGKDNKFINNEFCDLDIAIQDEGEGTFAEGNNIHAQQETKTHPDVPRIVINIASGFWRFSRWVLRPVYKWLKKIGHYVVDGAAKQIANIILRIFFLLLFVWIISRI